MAFTRSESASPLLVKNYCLLCREALKSSSQLTSAENAEVLQDIFQVFSKYMEWDPPPEYKYDFHKDQFPFCRVCNLILIRIYKIHENIQSLEKQIDQFVLSATAKIVDSDYTNVASSFREENQCSSNPNLKEIAITSCESVRVDASKICVYYRESISNRFSMRVQLTSEDAKQLENYKRAAKSKADALLEVFDQDNDNTHGNWMPSPECSEYSEDNSKNVRDVKANNNRIRTARNSKRVPDSSDQERSGGSDKEVEEYEIPGGKKQAFSSRIKELRPNEYLLDDKLNFVFQNPDWKCSSCNKTTLERRVIINHITSTRCSGLVSPNSVKELQHRGFKYDKLDDGRFECRRCPFAAPSNSTLKRHIVGSHCSTLNKRHWFVKTASITQPCPNVFLVNDKHEFRLTDSNFSCSACSYRTRVKTAVINHVFLTHENSGTRKPIAGMKIHRLGPNKYKFGDFPFEAFPDEYKCTTCGHASVSLLHMKRHIRYEHVKDKTQNVCDICGYSTFDKTTFNRHLSSHKDDRPFLCPTCGKSFKLQTNLSAHAAQVHPKSPIVKSHLCDICGKKFRKQYELTGHMKLHENVACEICGKTYNSLYLPKHLERHMDEKKYECKQCGSKFQHTASLSTHRKSCNGEKPYSCDLCGMKFTQPFSVTRHKNVVHNPEKKTRTCAVKGPRKQRRGQSLLTKNKSLSAAASDVSGSENALNKEKLIRRR